MNSRVQAAALNPSVEHFTALGKELMKAGDAPMAYRAFCQSPGCKEAILGKRDALQVLVRGHWLLDEAAFCRDAARDRRTIRVFAASDLHVDQGSNLDWCRQLSGTTFLGDILLLAGDVADSLAGVRLALQLVRPKFRRVFYCPGNHDLWIRGK